MLRGRDYAAGMHKHGAFLAVIAVCLGCAAGAQAQSLYAGGLLGYGFSTEKHSPVNPYGLGLGLSAGLTLPGIPIYAGARLVGFLGAKGHTPSVLPGASATEQSLSYLTYGIDLGYELGKNLVLRPSLGIGRAVLKGKVTIPGAAEISASDGSLYLAPGIALLVKAGLLFVGAEARYMFLTESKHVSGMSLLASVGVTL